MSEPQLDLSKLALDRGRADLSAQQAHPRRWLTRYVLPLGILLGFLALLGAAAGRHWWSERSVVVVPVIVKRGSVQPSGATLFQAAGWIEPRPTAIQVAAMSPGVIKELLVVEGQQVEQDEPIARLIATDAELAVERAQAMLAIREGDLARVQAEQTAAVVRLENPVHLDVLVADARSSLARSRTELEKLPFLIETARANLAFATSSLKSKQSAESAIAGVVVEQAVNAHAVAASSLQELRQRVPNLRRETEALQSKVDALVEQRVLLVEETRQLQEASAKVVSASAVRDEASLGVRQAQLNLERTVIRAPITGKILRLVSSPGSRVMGIDARAGHSSSTVVDMYDPGRLQVRADVRLEHVPMVTSGAPVEVETASSGKVIQGRVLQSTSAANIQKNTLEVKVELLEPPPTVRPDMLVTARFLAPLIATRTTATMERDQLLVPVRLVSDENGERFVWIVDGSGRAVRTTIKSGVEYPDGLVEVVDGLNVTDKLIASDIGNLQPGEAVTVTGEEQTLGRER